MAASARYPALMAHDTAMNLTSNIVALSSAIAFALQISLALLMLRYFSPKEVGTFSVISQIGFFWTTLALAQAPLQLLANQSDSVHEDTRQAWLSSIQHFLWLLPVVVIAVWWSSLSFVNALLWTLLLSVCQLTWMLAQSMYLRMASLWLLVGTRVLPPLASLIFACIAILFKWDGPALLSAALFGYATGAAWLLPSALQTHSLPSQPTTPPTSHVNTTAQSNPSILCNSNVPRSNIFESNMHDNRTPSLRIGHSFVDALLVTVFLLVWQRLYGAEETGWMAAPLRVMGFLPAVIHMAWAQVLIAQPQHSRNKSLWVGLGGFAVVVILCTLGAIALQIGVLGNHWQGILSYLLPLTLWQGCACISAAYSDRAFLYNVASKYSWICISVSAIQGSILLLPFISPPSLPLNASNHIWIFSATSSLGLLVIAYWLANFSPSPE